MTKEVMTKVTNSLDKNNNIPFDLKNQIGALLELLELTFDNIITDSITTKLETFNIKALSKYYTTDDMVYDEIENSLNMSVNISDGSNALMRAILASLFCKEYNAKYKALAIGINRQITNCILGDSATNEFMLASLISKFIDDDRINEELGVNYLLDSYLKGNLPFIESKMIEKGLTPDDCETIFDSANSTYYTLQNYQLGNDKDENRCTHIINNNGRQIYNIFKSAELKSERTDEEKQSFLILLDTWYSTLSKENFQNVNTVDIENVKKR